MPFNIIQQVVSRTRIAFAWREPVKRGMTFAEVAEAYIALLTNRRAKKDAEAIRRHLVKAWGDKPVDTITPRDVRTFIGGLAKRAPYSAAEAWKHCMLIFKWAVHEELVPVSPCASLDKRLTLNAKLQARTRILTDDELRALWRVAERIGYPYGHLYKMLMLTACRLREVNDAKWVEFDVDRKLWVIPAERFKTGQVHIVPLTDAMLSVLASIPRTSEYVFTSDGKKPLNGWSKVKRRVDRLMGEALTGPWINHDIRRTVRTQLAAMGVADHIAEMVLGHGRKGIQRVYDQHKYLNEIRAALEAWSRRLATFTDLP